MTDIAALKSRNRLRWGQARITRASEFAPIAKRLVAAKDRYQVVSDKTGVPWFVIAVIHEREASQNWKSNLAQGDPWNRKSIHVPKGRGPFKSWEDAAIDALVNCPPHAAKWRDWTPGGTMTLLEEYNGLGYAARGLPSPYVWSGTDQYVKGKYIADGEFDPGAVDKQLGCAGLILAMRKIDPSIGFDNIPAPPPPDVAAVTEPDDTAPHAAPASAPKSGITEGAKVGAGLGVAGVLSQLWDGLQQAPDTILQAIIAAAQKPAFWVFVGVVAAGVYVWYRRRAMKAA